MDDIGENVTPPLGIVLVEGRIVSVTQEIEIIRRDLTKIFIDTVEAMPNVTFRYRYTVDEIY